MARRWQVLTVVSVAVFVVSLDLFIVNIAFPDIRADFDGTSVAGVSWVLNAYAIVFAALLVPAGRIADRIGRRRGFLGGLTVFVAGSALCGLAQSVEMLVAARVVQAVGAAALMPTSLALLLPEFPPAKRPVAIGIWAAVGGVAAALGPVIGGLLVQVDWRLVFFVNLPVGAVTLVWGARLLTESHDPSQRWPDLFGTVLLAASVGVLALGLVEAPDWGWGDARTVACLAAAVLGFAAFLWRCARHPVPVVDLEMLRVRSFALSNVSVLLFNVAFAAMLLESVLFMTGVWGDSVLRAGLSIAPGPMMAAVLSVISGRAAGRIGQRRLATAGCLAFAAGAAWWLWRLGVTREYVTAMLPGLVLTGVGVGLTLPSLSSAVASSLPPARFATGSAVLTMSRQLGSVLGVSILVAILGGSAADPLDPFRGGWTLMIVAALLGAGAALAMGPLTRSAVATATAAAS